MRASPLWKVICRDLPQTSNQSQGVIAVLFFNFDLVTALSTRTKVKYLVESQTGQAAKNELQPTRADPPLLSPLLSSAAAQSLIMHLCVWSLHNNSL